MRKYFCFLIFLPLILGAFEPAVVTPHAVVGYREIVFHDDYNNSDRSILVWYPVDPADPGSTSDSPWDLFYVAKDAPILAGPKRPVIALSHGYTGNPHQLSWLIRALVYGGNIVIAVQHMDHVAGKVHINHWQRAQDISLIIDQFSRDDFAGNADLDKIGVAGFSLGGTTAIWIAGGRSTRLQTLIPGPEFAAPDDYTQAEQALPTLNRERMTRDWRDARVKAAFVMAPAWAWIFEEQSLGRVSIPVYLIAAKADKILVSQHNAGFFARYIPNSTLQLIPGAANHFIFISALSEAARKKADPKNELKFLFAEDVTVDRAWIQQQVGNEAVRFFDSVFTSQTDSD